MEQIKQLIEKLSNLIDKEQYKKALETYEKSAQSILETAISPLHHKALLLLGSKTYYFNQKYNASNACLSRLQRKYKEIDLNIDYIKSKFNILCAKGKTTEALGFIKRAISQDWPQDEYHVLYYNLGKAYFWNGDYFEANSCLQQCYRYYTSISNRYMLGNVTYMLGFTAFQRSFFDISGSFYEKALEHFRDAGENDKVGGTYQMLGILAYRTGRYEDATENIRLAKSYFQKCKNQTGIIESDIAAARVSIYLEEYE